MTSRSATPLAVDADADADAAVVRYTMDAEERPTEALPVALEAAGLDPMEADTVLHDWIDGDAVDSLLRRSGADQRFSTVVWDRRVVIGSDEIVVYGR
jgi:hypothetical protein